MDLTIRSADARCFRRLTGTSAQTRQRASGGVKGYILSNGRYKTLVYAGAQFTYANGINDSGKVVGRYDIGLSSHGFMYLNGKIGSRKKLNGRIPTLGAEPGR